LGKKAQDTNGPPTQKAKGQGGEKGRQQSEKDKKPTIRRHNKRATKKSRPYVKKKIRAQAP